MEKKMFNAFSLNILCIYIINLFIEMWIEDSYIFFILQSYIF